MDDRSESKEPVAETSPGRVTVKDPALKLAHRRLTVLELAETLGNVSEACRRGGIDRTSFYEWKRRFQTHGLEGLKDLPPIHKTHPQTTPPEVEARVIALADEKPTRGCNWISNQLALEGIALSSVTVQRLLIKHQRASRYDRLLRLEERALREGVVLTGEQVAQIEKANPAFRERHVESSAPGELLCQDTFYVGHLKGVGKVYLQSVVDTFGSFAFGFLHTTKRPECAVAVLHNEVLPFYRALGLAVSKVLTDNGREYCGTPNHPYELYLELCDIRHKRTKVGRPQTNGFVERFHRTVLDEFFRTAFRTTLYTDVESLQKDLDAWLEEYNYHRPHQGYRNMGRRPYDTIAAHLAEHNGATRAERSEGRSTLPSATQEPRLRAKPARAAPRVGDNQATTTTMPAAAAPMVNVRHDA